MKYQQKIISEAEQYDGSLASVSKLLLLLAVQFNSTGDIELIIKKRSINVKIHDLQLSLQETDWLIKEGLGNIFVLSNPEFAKRFEACHIAINERARV